jgi:hypothetical protein
VFHADLHEVAIYVIAHNVTQKVLQAFCPLERIEMVHFEYAEAFRSEDDGTCKVSVNTHFV